MFMGKHTVNLVEETWRGAREAAFRTGQTLQGLVDEGVRRETDRLRGETDQARPAQRSGGRDADKRGIESGGADVGAVRARAVGGAVRPEARAQRVRGGSAGRQSTAQGKTAVGSVADVRIPHAKDVVADPPKRSVLAVSALLESGVLKTGAQLKAEQEANGGTNREAIQGLIHGRDAHSGGNGGGGSDAGARGPREGSASRGAWRPNLGIRSSDERGQGEHREFVGSRDALPRDEAVPDLSGAGSGAVTDPAQAERERLAARNYLRTHPEDESHGTVDEEVGF